MNLTSNIPEQPESFAFWFTRKVLWRLRKPTFIVLLGGPGAGKGTLAKQLAQKLKLAHLSTGDALRTEIANKTELGLSIQALVKDGKLLSDSIILAVVKRELQRSKYRRGAILDGIPRTFLQSQLLDTLLAAWGVKVNFAVSLEPDVDTLIYRLSNRLTCKKCGRTYHLVSKPPHDAGICDAPDCRGELYQRPDDNPDSIRERLSTYEAESKPIREHYGRGLIVVKPTKESSEQQVFSEVTAALKG